MPRVPRQNLVLHYFFFQRNTLTSPATGATTLQCQGKTDYRAWIRLINQDIIAQITSATIAGDNVLAAAYAHELPHYGLEANGEDYSVEPAETRRPFRALLDVGLIRTTTCNRVFGALKGALDGGLDIPHSDKGVLALIRIRRSLMPRFIADMSLVDMLLLI
ncbi:hypothetical protein VNO80_00768 [Phaseolus coccineus]|uniref:Uncharacterized protein n=1 Tax=Phaseolus coccineus TaxID=3886 RepID=A0AAN9P480_PHACN